MRYGPALAGLILLVGAVLSWLPATTTAARLNLKQPTHLGSQPDSALRHLPKLPDALLLTPRLQDETARGLKRRAFLEDFLRLSPPERLRLWNKRVELGSVHAEMERLLIVRGLDTVPYLAKIVRSAKSEETQLNALKLLCDMDRFVPAEQLVLPELGGSIFREEIFTRGLFDKFMIVDGRRVGPQGIAAVRWASEQTEKRDLRFHAREYSGLLDQELQQLTLDEQFSRWRAAVIKTKGILAVDPDTHTLMLLLERRLIERAPASIVLLANTLEHDSDGYVCEEAIHSLQLIDQYRVRLRAIDGGRAAVAAIRRALDGGRLKPIYAKRTERENYWRKISAQVFDDDLPLDNQSDWALYALALERFYGVHATNQYCTVPDVRIVEARQDFRPFLTFLTTSDPYFPSWEYTDVGWGWDEVLHPRFKQKVARIYEEWREFNSK